MTETDTPSPGSLHPACPTLGSPLSEVEWTIFLYEIRHSSVRILYNRQEIVKAATRKDALGKSKNLEQVDTHVIGVSLIPTKEYNALNCHNWK